MKRAPSTTDRPPHISVSNTYFWVRGLYQEEGLLPTECSYCGQGDSFAYLVSCVNIGPDPTERDGPAEYLIELADRAYNANPGNPRPIRPGGGVEEELLNSDEAADDDERGDWLDLENDTVAPFDEAGFLAALSEAGSLWVELLR